MDRTAQQREIPSGARDLRPSRVSEEERIAGGLTPRQHDARNASVVVSVRRGRPTKRGSMRAIKAIRMILVIALLLALTGCRQVVQPETTRPAGGYVRFSNETHSPGVAVDHGIRVSEAVYLGALFPGNVTAYYSFSTSGDYPVQTSSGSAWHDITDAWAWGGGNRYTVKLTGTGLHDLVISRVVD